MSTTSTSTSTSTATSDITKLLGGAAPSDVLSALDKEETTLKHLLAYYQQELERVQMEETLLQSQLKQLQQAPQVPVQLQTPPSAQSSIFSPSQVASLPSLALATPTLGASSAPNISTSTSTSTSNAANTSEDEDQILRRLLEESMQT